MPDAIPFAAVERSLRANPARYVPPFAVIKRALRLNADLEPGRKTLVSGALLRLLLSLVLADAAFDEKHYLQANPDVAKAVAEGTILDPYTHYLAHGHFEGRRGTAPPEVDEAWYLRQYPDVAEAISAGRTRSAAQHYEEIGEREMRIPNPELAAEIRHWAEALAANA